MQPTPSPYNNMFGQEHGNDFLGRGPTPAESLRRDLQREAQRALGALPVAKPAVELPKFLKFEEVQQLLTSSVNDTGKRPTCRAQDNLVLDLKQLHDTFGLPPSTKDQYGRESGEFSFDQVHFENNRDPYATYGYGYNRQTVVPKEPIFVSLGFANYTAMRTYLEESPGAFQGLKPVKLDVIQAAIVCQHEQTHRYSSSQYHYGGYRNSPIFLLLQLNYHGQQVCFLTGFRIAEALFSLSITDDFEFQVLGKTYPISDAMRKQLLGTEKESVTLQEVLNLSYMFNDTNVTELLKAAQKKNLLNLKTAKGTGIQKTMEVAQHFAQQIKDDPLALIVMNTLAAHSNRTISKVKVSTVFNLLFGKIKSTNDFLEAVKPVKEAWFKHKNIDSAIEELRFFKDKRKTALKAASTRAFEKLMEDYEFLSLDEEKYPKVTAAIKEGLIPLSTFFRKKEQYFLLNDNWSLWEVMLDKHYDLAVELAKEVSKRTTYEKDLMSYFFFILYALPEYLEQHTGSKWTCVPKLIDSPSELDPPAVEEGGVARKRSALTPTVDNDKRVVTVPYASLGMPGRQTTYAYSHNYHVIDRGLVFNGNVAMSGIEAKLNGRDDYGLMFYTLTGSVQGRGYPTFLIIFEKRKNGPYLHFHRVHPCRSKDGDYNPIHNWVKTAYNWMAGNVNRKLLKAQQGDIIFAETTEEGKTFDTQVNNYDNHMFATQVLFAKYEKKDKANILGYVKLKEDTVLNHHEHDALNIPAGVYELRGCRSWEANPSGVWTLRID